MPAAELKHREISDVIEVHCTVETWRIVVGRNKNEVGRDTIVH